MAARSERRRASATRGKRLVGLGLAVAALILPATAEARPLDVIGIDSRLIRELSVPFDASANAGASTRHAAAPRVAKTDTRDAYDAGTGTIGGLLLIVTAAGAAVAVRHSRKTKLSPA